MFVLRFPLSLLIAGTRRARARCQDAIEGGKHRRKGVFGCLRRNAEWGRSGSRRQRRH